MLYVCLLSGTPVGYFGRPVTWISRTAQYNTEFSNQITYEGINYSDALKQYEVNVDRVQAHSGKVRITGKNDEENSDVVLQKESMCGCRS